MSAAQIHLSKTLCAMRWIALMNDRHDIAKAIAHDQSQMTGGAA
jgi:hypothetical protein